MLTPTDILREAKRLITEKGWTQGAYARNAAGDEVVDEATCYCLYGAVDQAAGEAYSASRTVAWDTIRELTPRRQPISFNDDPRTTKDDVIALLDKAIAVSV